jgi:hypothetical protein
MASLWFSVDDTDCSDGDPGLGIFVDSPAVIGALLPRPKAPFVYFAADSESFRGGKDDGSDEAGYESPIVGLEPIRRRPLDRPGISIFDLP